jgi:hypothetical protein
MATYLNDLRLTELATGEGSGTWGTTTNLSLELIGEALGFATQQVFGSDADATTTIADGASDPARAMYFKITSAGSLTATRTCTIAPNTISRVMFIENATTGSQSIQISQGSGASVTILAGKTAVVYLDGAGAGAAVVDAMAGVDPGVTDTLAEVLAAGNTSGANNLIIDNGQAITTNTINETTAASGVTIDSVLLKDDGVNATNLEITNIKANDGTSAGSIADSTGVVTLASSVLTTADINGGTIDGTTIGATTPASVAATTGTFSGDISVAGIGTIKQIDTNSVMIGAGAVNLRMIDVTSDIRPVDSAGLGVDGTVDLGDANARFKDLYLSGTSNVGVGRFTAQSLADSAASLVLGHEGSSKSQIRAYGINAGTIGSLEFMVSAADGTGSKSMTLDANGGIVLPTAGSYILLGGSNPAVNAYIQESSSSIILGSANTPRMTLDASGNLGIGTSSPVVRLNPVVSYVASTIIPAIKLATVGGYNSGSGAAIDFGQDQDTYPTWVTGRIASPRTGNNWGGSLTFSTNDNSAEAALVERMTLDASGNIGVGAAATAGVVNANSTRVTIAGTNAASNGGEFIAGGAAAKISMASGTSKSYLWGSGAYPMSFGTNSTERMVLDASGDLTTTGAATFGGNVVGLTFESSVSSSSTNLATNSGGSLTLKNTSVTDGNFSNIGGYNSNTLVTSQINFVNVSQASRTGAITFNVHNGTSMPEVGRFDASGNFLVGTTSVFSGSGITPLMTVSKSAGSGIGVNLIGSSEVGLATRPSADHNYYAGFFLNNAGTGVGNITVGSSTTAYNTSSDERLKENITDANDAGNKIDAIKVRQYDWKADGSHQDYGMIAQELMTVAPEAVSAPEDPEQMMGVDYSKLVPMMLKEIQSLRARISQLEGAN